MTNRHIQKFPSGEIRIFAAPSVPEGEQVQPLALVEHVRAPGDQSTDDLIGTAIEDMPPPFDPDAE